MRINFVMSNTIQSGIFNAINNFFKQYISDTDELFISQYPLNQMDIYHYHRPNLEEKLLENSVVTVHHDLEDNDAWFIPSNYIDRYREANKVICLNSTQQKILKEKYLITNTIVIPHGVNKKIFSQEEKIVQEKFVIGIISKRYGRRVKGEAYLLELYKRLDSTKIKFIFVGDGRTIDKNESEKFGFEAEVFEKLPYELFNSLYQNIHILLIASLFEGGPANLPEALYTKTPILGRKIAMIKDFLKEEKNGYFLTGDFDIDSDLINALAYNVNNIYTNLMKNISDNENNVLDWKDVVQLHQNIYKNLLEGNC